MQLLCNICVCMEVVICAREKVHGKDFKWFQSKSSLNSPQWLLSCLGNVPDDFFTFNQPPLPDIRVELFDLKDVYDKVQTKVPRISEQRIAKGWVNGVAWSAGQINSITVLVRRTPEAAARVNDTVGW